MKRKAPIGLSRLKASQLALLTGKRYGDVLKLLRGLEPVEVVGRTQLYRPQQALERIYKLEPESSLRELIEIEIMLAPYRLATEVFECETLEDTIEVLRKYLYSILAPKQSLTDTGERP